jgi:hypothetical protein
MVRSSARVDLGIQDVGIVLFIRWRLGPSGTSRRLGRLDSAGAAPGGGSERSHSRVLLRNNSAVRKSTEQGSCGNAGATARARDAIFRCEPKLDAA